MRRTTTLALTAALAVGGIAAVDGGTDPALTSERVYAHCGDTQKVSNVEGGTPFASDTEPPAASFTAGGGCGTADAVLSPVENEAGELLEFTASYTGNVDTLTLELHMIDAGIVRLSETAPTGELPNPGDPVPGLAFDEIYAETTVFVTSADGTVRGFTGEAQFPSERSETGISTRLRMTITDIGLLGEEEAGTHEVTVRVKTADYYNGDSGGWVLDATEVPTGITFNPPVEEWAPYQVTGF
jgi:hypothetical protein